MKEDLFIEQYRAETAAELARVSPYKVWRVLVGRRNIGTVTLDNPTPQTIRAAALKLAGDSLTKDGFPFKASLGIHGPKSISLDHTDSTVRIVKRETA